MVVDINTEKFLSLKIGDWVHSVQSLIRINPNITLDALKSDPRTNWDSYQRIIELIDLSKDGGGFCCKFKILRNLTVDGEKVYSFNEKTVPANFAV